MPKRFLQKCAKMQPYFFSVCPATQNWQNLLGTKWPLSGRTNSQHIYSYLFLRIKAHPGCVNKRTRNNWAFSPNPEMENPLRIIKFQFHFTISNYFYIYTYVYIVQNIFFTELNNKKLPFLKISFLNFIKNV